MFSARSKALSDPLLRPLALRLMRLGITQTAITLTGLGLVLASCLWVILTKRLLLFCVLVLAASLFDVLDGAMARAGGKATAAGAYLDAVCDRYAEAAIVLTVAWVTGLWLLSGLVLAGALLTSYAKARAAMETSVSNLEWPDLLERPERGMVYVAGLAASRLTAWRPLGQDVFWWALLLLAVLTHATALQRIRRALRFIRTRSGR